MSWGEEDWSAFSSVSRSSKKDKEEQIQEERTHAGGNLLLTPDERSLKEDAFPCSPLLEEEKKTKEPYSKRSGETKQEQRRKERLRKRAESEQST